MKIYLIIVFLIFNFFSFSQESYHKNIWMAEYDVANDSLLKASSHYSNAFKLMQFPFEKDLKNALIVNLQLNNWEYSNNLIIQLIKKGYSINEIKAIPFIKKLKHNEHFKSILNDYFKISKDVIRDSSYISSLKNLSILDRDLTLKYRNRENVLSCEEKLILKNQDSLIYSEFLFLIKKNGWPTEEQIGYQVGNQILIRNFLIHSTSYNYYDSTILYNAYFENKIPSYILTYFEEYRLNRKSVRKHLKINDFEYDYQIPFLIHNLTTDDYEHLNPFLKCPKILKTVEKNRINFDLSPLNIYRELITFSKKSKIYNFYCGLYTPLSNISFESDFQKERFEVLKKKWCNED